MRYFYLLNLLLTTSLLVSCSIDDDHLTSDVNEQVDLWENHEAFEGLDYNVPFGLDRTTLFSENVEERGESDLIEASGIVASVSNPGFLWTHEDKNNTNEIFLLDMQTGETVASYELDGIFNRDWEDIEIGPGPEEGTTYIYLGETGDNDRVYNGYEIYRFEEPVFEESHRGQKITIESEIETLKFRYPDGLKHDVETLLLDPITKDLFLVTKRSFFSTIYVLPYPQDTENSATAIKVGEFPFTRAVGGNISFDGQEMLIKTYDYVMFWQRSLDESMVDMFMKTPELAPYTPEPQGEAICFDQQGNYYTLSEFSNSIVPVLYFYERL